MQTLDWIILIITLAFIVAYGAYQTRGSRNVQDYIRGGNTAKWWTIGLSVMATQASAITFLSTPGQAFNDGMGFVQFYFGVPIAMVIISLVFIPIYHRLKVYTAYEYLESRFDLKTRSLAAILFLVQRGLAAGITIFAPAIILSAVLGWNLTILNILIGVLVIIYTVSGGTKAVNVTQKHQMAVIFSGMFIAFFLILSYLPDDITFKKALDIAGASGKMDVLDFSFSLDNRYTFWSGIIGGSFLALSYFGTDQSQVQRYLTGSSIKEMRIGMLFNGLLKVPMQFFILLVGVMVFVFFQFNQSPLNFNPAATQAVYESEYADEYRILEAEHQKTFNDKQLLINEYIKNGDEKYKQYVAIANEIDQENRDAAKELISKANVEVETNDKDYVFIHFILKYLPKGLIGLLLAVILSAAMSSTASELNALASTTTIDLYKRNLRREEDDAHFVKGIFLLAFFFKFVKSNAVFVAALITQVIVITLWRLDATEVINLPFLWLNFVGCIIVIILAILLQSFQSNKPS